MGAGRVDVRLRPTLEVARPESAIVEDDRDRVRRGVAESARGLGHEPRGVLALDDQDRDALGDIDDRLVEAGDDQRAKLGFRAGEVGEALGLRVGLPGGADQGAGGGERVAMAAASGLVHFDVNGGGGIAHLDSLYSSRWLANQ